MKKINKVITYYYRGMIERGANYHWVEGWSANSEDGFALYPWSTQSECRTEAKLQGATPVFVRNEKQRIA